MKKLIIFILPFLLVTACVDSLDDYNIDQKRASVIPPRTLFTNAMKGLTDILTTPNVNSNNYRMFVQYWATTTYLDEPRYNMTARAYSASLWNAIYRDVLSDLKEAKRLINLDAALNADIKANQLAIIEIMEVYSWRVLVNTFGDVPYSEALDTENLLPVYDDAATIYSDLAARLDAANASLVTSATSFGTADVLYSGSTAKWLKFGTSLKLKMGMELVDANPSKAKTMVEQAAAGGGVNLITTNGDNARFPYIAAAPNNNPVSGNISAPFTSREDFVVAGPIVSAMNTLEDPRRLQYFTTIAGGFVGGNYGFSNAFANFSKPSAKIGAPTLEGILMEASEIEFMLAEAVERGFTVGGTAEEHYNNAIAQSILYWGGEEGDPAKQKAVFQTIVAGGSGYAVNDILTVFEGVTPSNVKTQFKVLTVNTSGAITSVAIEKAGEYSVAPTGPMVNGVPLVTTTVQTSAGLPGTGTGATLRVVYDGGWKTYLLRPEVAYSTAPGTYKQKIGTQKWIAMFNRGWESWVEWRRLDAPTLNPPTGAGITTALKIPVRMIYPVSEQTLNGGQWEIASGRFGGDSPDSKLFWDKN
jgi:hypothetical protein